MKRIKIKSAFAGAVRAHCGTAAPIPMKNSTEIKWGVPELLRGGQKVHPSAFIFSIPLLA